MSGELTSDRVEEMREEFYKDPKNRKATNLIAKVSIEKALHL